MIRYQRFLLALVATSSLIAQTSVNPDEFLRAWSTSKQFTIAVAQAMPEEKYEFRVNAEEMTFAGLMVHIATSQAFRFAQIAGTKLPFGPPPKTMTKADVIGLLTKAFDFCIEQLKRFTPEQMAKSYKVDWYEQPAVTGPQLVLGMFTHTAHHRAQAEVYLRANGITPPPYRF
jgi:uncharacterized damage-inducible protein DinB